MNDEMTPELRAKLLERLTVRANRLAKMAAIDAPTPVLSLMAENVAVTSMLLLGEKFAQTFLQKLMMSLRENNGICLCGTALMVEGEPLCQACIEDCERDDREADEYMAMQRPAKGRPS